MDRAEAAAVATGATGAAQPATTWGASLGTTGLGWAMGLARGKADESSGPLAQPAASAQPISTTAAALEMPRSVLLCCLLVLVIIVQTVVLYPGQAPV